MTAEEFIKNRYDLNSEQLERIKENMSKMPMIDFDNIPDLMISFAQYHVEKALKAAHRNFQAPEEDLEFTLNSYPENLIK